MASPEEVVIKRCPKDHECPSAPAIFQTFSLDSSEVLNAYAVGSHLWGTCSRHSDWDFVIITRRGGSPPVNAHKSKLDAWIISLEDYACFLKDHLIQALITIWLPECFVLKESFDPKTLFKYSRESLFASVDKMHGRDLKVARKHFTKNDPQGGLKILRHCLRQLELATQIHQQHKITNYTEANDKERELRERGFEHGPSPLSWDEAISIVQPHMDTILSQLRQQ